MPAEKRSSDPNGGRVQALDASSDDAERWSRVKAIVLDALDLPGAERAEFVARSCAGDDELRREVETLLASADAAGSFGERPAAEVLGQGEAAALEPATRLPAGSRLGAYEITAFVAAGGMGEVYRARHTVLGREVALKTVGAAAGDAAARRRLIREAQHASTLKHPNICTIHEVGESEDGPFIVMEYVNGRPLRDLLQEALPTLGEALGYAIQVAGALEHAHRQGIVHRDLKSSNIVVDAAGRAIVLDFGLARRLPGSEAGAPESTLTAQGALAGTLSHMAPEVLRAGRADARSDVWALGVLLYELATGELPFRGRTPFETSSAILGEPPRPMGRRVPLAYRLVVERCLVKDPDARYQSAAEVGSALEAIRRRRAWPLVGRLLVSVRRRTLATAGILMLLAAALLAGSGRLRRQVDAVLHPPAPTLALLPLENATGDAGAAYYAEGLTDGLIAQLGALTDVRMISRASAERAARTAATPAETAERLGAAMLIEGSLRRASDRVVLDVRLVRPSDGRAIWSETFERGVRDVLALQADVTRALALEVRLAVRPGARERLNAVRAVAPEVYEAYLKGRFEWNQRTPASLQRAIAHFRRAVELDPTYAPAHAALADCYNQLGTVMVGTGSPREWRPRAAAEAIKTLQIDRYSAEAHATLGYVRHYEWRWAEAEQEFRRAIELNPSYSLARIWYANLLMSLGRMDEALAQVYAARDLDPFSLIVNANVGWVLNYAGRHEEAVRQLERTLEMDSTYAQARWRLVGALQSAGRNDEALDQAERLLALTSRSAPALWLVAGIHVAAGRREEVRAILEELVARSRTEYVPPYSIAGLYRALGDDENGVAWLQKAFDEHSNAIAYMRSDTVGFGRDPRYRRLMARAGFR